MKELSDRVLFIVHKLLSFRMKERGAGSWHSANGEQKRRKVSSLEFMFCPPGPDNVCHNRGSSSGSSSTTTKRRTRTSHRHHTFHRYRVQVISENTNRRLDLFSLSSYPRTPKLETRHSSQNRRRDG